MSNFHVGQRVVCIKRGKWVFRHTGKVSDEKPNETYPDFGATLTIRGIMSRDTGSFLLFEEIRNPLCRINAQGEPSEVSFGAIRFRPLIETDISNSKPSSPTHTRNWRRSMVDTPRLDNFIASLAFCSLAADYFERLLSANTEWAIVYTLAALTFAGWAGIFMRKAFA